MRIFLSTVFIVCTCSMFGQSLNFEKAFGGGLWDRFQAVNQTADGGLICLGYVTSGGGGSQISTANGSSDFFAVKLNAIGQPDWITTYGGSEWDEGNSVLQTSDGGFLLAGVTDSNDFDVANNFGGSDYWVVKIDADGIIEWEQNYGGSGNDNLFEIKETLDGNFILVGFSDSTDGQVNGSGGAFAFIVKIDIFGNVIWANSYIDFAARNIISTSDGGYIIGGNGDVVFDYKLLKIDGSGSVQWSNTYGGTSNESLYDLIQTNDGGLALAGQSYSSDVDVSNNYGSADIWVVKTDANGNLLWEKNFGGSSFERVNNITQAFNGDFYIGGLSSSNDIDVSDNFGSNDIWIFQIDNVGNLLCEHNFGSTSTDIPDDMILLDNNELVVVGSIEGANNDVSSMIADNGTSDAWVARVFLSCTGCPLNFSGSNSLYGFGSTIGGTYGNGDYETDGTIESTQIIVNGTTIDYDSNTSICLQPGFRCGDNATFTAFIDGCNNGSGGNNLSEQTKGTKE